MDSDMERNRERFPQKKKVLFSLYDTGVSKSVSNVNVAIHRDQHLNPHQS